jgi:hypothetical protein
MSHVNPPNPIDTVYVFHIGKLISERENTYEATRKYWIVSKRNQSQLPAYAVGLIEKVSVSSYIIERWYDAKEYDGRFAFDSPNHPNPIDFTPLLNKDWSRVINAALGFYLHGGYLMVQFDGKGKFRIKRGSSDNKTWHNC